jgi:hypothetical protein
MQTFLEEIYQLHHHICLHLLKKIFFYFLAFFIWQEEDAFFTDYAISHKKLSELGFTRPSLGASRTSTRQSAVVVAVAAMMVIFGYFFDFFKIYKKSHQK